jgi:hypothetical protein
VEFAALAGPTRTVVLVRPDAYIAWATDEPHPERRAIAIRNALTHWCGTPAGTPAASHPAAGRS